MQATEELTDKEVVAVDGKTLRRSYQRHESQKQIVKTIVKKKADYCIAVKKSQKSPYQALQDAFELSNSNEPRHIEQHHGRVEYRAYDVLSRLNCRQAYVQSGHRSQPFPVAN